MFLIIDFLNVAYRSFYAIRELSTSKGVPTNAVYGFIQCMRRWMAEVKPSHLAIVFDAETPQRRLDLLPEYKSTRPPTPESLIPQLARLSKLMPMLGWPTAFDSLEEADDLAAGIALKAANLGHEVRIGSNDKDFFQIVSPRIKVLRSTPKETVLADEAWVKARWGIDPLQMADFLSLQGDAVDNIPGAPGVGEKTAADLIQRFGSVEGVLASMDQITKPKLKESLQSHADALRRNLKLIRLNPDTRVPPLDDFRLKPPQYDLLLPELAELEFKGLLALYTKESEKTSDSRQAMLF